MFSFYIVVLLVTRNYFNSTYADPKCLMKLVNTTAPQHYEVHPFWKDIVYDDSCDLAPFVQQQFDNKFEFVFFERFCAVLFVVAAAVVLYKLPTLFSLRGIVSWLLGAGLAVMAIINMLMLSHFEQDITFFSANIMHHADISAFSDQSNASLVDTLPQGFMLTSCLNMLYGYGFVYCVAKYDRVAKKSYYPLVMAALFALQTIRSLLIIKTGHPVFHEIASEEGKNANILSKEFAAYRHVFIHHVNGDSFGSSYTFDWLYSAALYGYGNWHNHILQLQLDTPKHYGFAVLVDTCMMMCWSLGVWAYMRVTAVLMTAMLGPIPTDEAAGVEKKVKKA
jgi:hypothetical protein